jgi:hypothetical protein
MIRVLPRSGLAFHQGIQVGAGVVDADYTGEIKVLLINGGTEPFRYSKGMKVAQLVLHHVATPPVVEVEELPKTARGEAGFGSTGSYTAVPTLSITMPPSEPAPAFVVDIVRPPDTTPTDSHVDEAVTLVTAVHVNGNLVPMMFADLDHKSKDGRYMYDNVRNSLDQHLSVWAKQEPAATPVEKVDLSTLAPPGELRAILENFADIFAEKGGPL